MSNLTPREPEAPVEDPRASGEREDERWMRRCLELARRGAGCTSPNPMVGAVVVGPQGETLGEGWHRAAGEPHAEVNALRAAEEAHGAEAHPKGTSSRAVGALRQATLYVNLEPCAHHGRTPPCTDLILEKGLARVVVGMVDPHEKAAGGIQRLCARGVDVTTGVLGRACRRLNEAFAHHTQTGRPLLTLKQAQTLTGQVATASGDSRWISSEASRRRVHRWRSEADAVLVGSGTAEADDPRLTVRQPEDRQPEGRQPRRIVLDRTGALSPKLHLFADAHAARTTAVIGAERPAPPYAGALQDAGGQLLRVPEAGGHLDLSVLLDRLGEGTGGARPDGADNSVQSLFVEAGPGLATALFEQDLVDRFYLFIAPRLIGAGTPAVGALGIDKVAGAVTFAEHAWETVGGDVLFKGFRRAA